MRLAALGFRNIRDSVDPFEYCTKFGDRCRWFRSDGRTVTNDDGNSLPRMRPRF